MSWIDRISNQLTITTGDGKVYQPSWLNATKQLEWNVAEFTFPGQDGTLVKKTKKLGTRFNLELYFQGEFHLDTSVEFETSLNDPRPIVLAHPFYGSIIVQAPSFNVDNSVLNISKWTGTVIETILENNPITTTDPVDLIRIETQLVSESFAQSLLATPSVTDVNTSKDTLKKNFNLTVPILTIPEEIETYFNLFSTANAALNTLVASPLLAMRTTIAVITAPATFTIGATQRINLLKAQWDNLRLTLIGVTSPASKQIYQIFGGSILAAMGLASSTPLPGDFTNVTKSLTIIDEIIETYNQYISDLDLLQTATGGTPTSFIPSSTPLQQLSQLINNAIANLFSIALSARKERSIITETDTNLIILTHRFYGLDKDDNNINELIENNGFGLIHMLQIRKGTKVIYYR